MIISNFLLYFLLTTRWSVGRTKDGENILSFLRNHAVIFDVYFHGTYLPSLAWSSHNQEYSITISLIINIIPR